MNRVVVCLAASLFGSLALPQFRAAEAAPSETVLYSFSDPVETPVTALTDVNGTLYGTTFGTTLEHKGTLFAFDPASGSLTVLHTFDSREGQDPASALLDVNGTLYGTTWNKDSCSYPHACGIVFSFDPAKGEYKSLHTFKGTDGANPRGDLANIDGTLYGTTENGGTNGLGTIFSIDRKTGAETVLHSFQSTDGIYPVSVLNVNGVLYGTTESGGSNNCNFGCGTLFSMDPATGTFTVLYSFDGNDGSQPGGLISISGILYGTTSLGGNGGCYYGDSCGTVFSFDPATGVKTVLYLFCSRTNCTDGEWPLGDLLSVNGVLYGTTYAGGANGGTVFKLTLDGKEKVVHSFEAKGADGSFPQAGLIRHNGVLYGTTGLGGMSNAGTIYSITPSAPPRRSRR